MQVNWSPCAVEALLEAADYIKQFSVGRSKKFYITVRRKVKLLGKQPFIGKKYERHPEYREFLIHKNYKVYYHIENSENEQEMIVIDTFRHCKMDYWTP